ncbi:DUF2584 domain-containing protein [Anoxybacillus rupiensis]|jgi:Protein of unknown function (DUF2584)|uniref:DUF2584 domain-containing protein n=1 Tax=Anoxybacteroides rupiense TaxID=311460 RepID=A0ABD5ISH3_9BACL|nr:MULTISPECIES: DUF2584 domain-containing protein [Anoxybacillus]KXG08813.1 hypothetical protein AT864_02921 [Anoxybacillus sp. P3H1B]MBB3906977.1 hypothetical protein [Anoxybacillus rupiensis]MBS2771495.1 DUF2584 domain-containing protein [Anoxybacillus rupiensis]MDE8564661.1 DUF2584 domain-containing protein [Anoxybacillus rupiensis]MED5051237.1 DUF2584 domain-containing protein [Anoxybacillus rupiensis]
MGMPLELQTLIVTKGKEQRIEDNLFVLEKEGYRLYPIDIPLEVKRTLQSEASGQAVVKKLELANNRTIITYELISLHSTN